MGRKAMFRRTLCWILAHSVVRVATTPSKAPNILLIVADDLGYNDVSYHGSEIQTPFIDALAREGVRLESYYTHYLCSPTRASMLIGRYPIRYGWQHENAPVATTPVAVPLEEAFLPQKLRDEAGYRTHMVGKWHLGYYATQYLPTSRGFDSHLGYYEGYMDYYTHTSTMDRLDLHNGTSCMPHLRGTYSLPIFLHEAQHIIRQHRDDEANRPLFLYLPFQSVHAPLEVPQRYIDRYDSIQDEGRRAYAGMVTYLDEAVASVVATVKAKGEAFWNNTVIFFVSDNGGQPRNSGNNYPLRGCKGTLFEGGMRAVALVHSPLIAKPRRIEHGLMHVTDLHATILSLARGHTDAAHTRHDLDPRPLDGLDQWPTIAFGAPSPRTELLHNFDPSFGGRRVNSSAIRRGPWKLIKGPYAACSPEEDALDCGWDKRVKREVARSLREHVALYNIEKDPYERANLAPRHPDIVAELSERLDEFYKESVPPLVAESEMEAWVAAVDKVGCTAPWH